jgi:hypothetical protein
MLEMLCALRNVTCYKFKVSAEAFIEGRRDSSDSFKFGIVVNKYVSMSCILRSYQGGTKSDNVCVRRLVFCIGDTSNNTLHTIPVLLTRSPRQGDALKNEEVDSRFTRRLFQL